MVEAGVFDRPGQQSEGQGADAGEDAAANQLSGAALGQFAKRVGQIINDRKTRRSHRFRAKTLSIRRLAPNAGQTRLARLMAP
jgi:hypothetical protein